MKPYTIRQIARLAGVSRATLLYYESLGLLLPGARSARGYRLYGEEELQRLRSIRALRESGVPIAAISSILNDRGRSSIHLLKQRLLQIDGEIRTLRRQQIMLARLLAQESMHSPGKVSDKASWVALMRDAGLGEDDMRLWHAQFETTAPDIHARFLASLGLSEKEITEIREWSRQHPDR